MKKLKAHISPKAKIQFEFEEGSERTKKEQELLEDNVFQQFQKNPVAALFYLGVVKTGDFDPSVNFWKEFASNYIERLRLEPDLESKRHKIEIFVEPFYFKNILAQLPFMQGAEYITTSVLQNYWEELDLFFRIEIKKYKGSVESYFHKFSPDVHLIGRIFFHLVENKKSEKFPFAFLATYASGAGEKNSSQHRPLKYALVEYEDQQEKMLELLSTVYMAAKESIFIKEHLDSGEIFHPISWTSNEALLFLNDVDIYEKFGILCRIPNWWKKKVHRSGLSISVGEKQPSRVGLEALVDFKVDITVGGYQLTQEEVEGLLLQTEGLAQIKGQWVPVDKEKLQKTLETWKNAQKLMKKYQMTLSEALRFLMNPQNSSLSEILDETVSVSTGEWLESLLGKMQKPEQIKPVAPPRDLRATLRPYQQQGLDWLTFMQKLGFGSCLADDMGLGKTLQVLALMLRRKEEKTAASLLVLPASLLGNWASEIKKFTSNFKFLVVHQSETTDTTQIKKSEIDSYDLVITTYGLVKRLEWFSKYSWDYLILDEAQAIKNPGTAQAKAVKKLSATYRLALTGTPIENRLADLWSLFDFLNPGLLGNYSEFTKMTKRLAEDPKRYTNLRRVVTPYILRRLKTDKKIISDLPEKVEMQALTKLSNKQVVLYKRLVDELEKTLRDGDGDAMKRRGVILASLLKFKQICNHPDQYLGQSAYKESESGKFSLLRELCETINEKREKVLIFTQFKEIIPALDSFLENLFGKKGGFLHGGVEVKKRSDLVKRFQSDEYMPYFILSIKAGGTGLNLTAANHVIHFDRWWNPAVENQATDRAFRIGQEKTVMVHKFVTSGTVEEKIAQMIYDKKELAENIVSSSGEKWITEFGNDELLDLFKMDINQV